MSLPPALLERLKRRKIIQETTSASPEQIPKAKDKGGSSKFDALHARYGHGESSKQATIVENSEQEEIIAEDYSDEAKSDNTNEQSDADEDDGDNDDDDDDDDVDVGNSRSDVGQHHEDDERISSQEDEDEDEISTDCNRADDSDTKEATDSVIGCPNKYNIYHTCNRYCQEQYGNLELLTPTHEQRKYLALILKTYPLPPDWSVVYDPGVKTFYYWNTVSNQVSWFPPGMGSPSSLSANHIRRTMKLMK